MKVCETGLPVLQLEDRPGIIDLGPGKADARSYPAASLERAWHEALRSPEIALGYGANQGVGPLLEWLACWLRSSQGDEIDPSRILLTAGASSGLDRLCSTLTAPGDVCFCEAPTYNYALRLLSGRGLTIVPVESDADGPTVESLDDGLRLLPRTQRQAFFYLVPVHANPRGTSVNGERLTQLIDHAAARGVYVVRDDVYALLSYTAEPPAATRLSENPFVVSLGSFSKLIAPGLRLGWIVAAPELVRAMADDGLALSGGGASHSVAFATSFFCDSGDWDVHYGNLLRVYGMRCDAMQRSLERYLSQICKWTTPRGGFFVWLRIPASLDAASLLGSAEEMGVSYAPGAWFYPASRQARGRDYLRLAFSRYDASDLDEGIGRLRQVIDAHRGC
jgi:2-aminoadipate transaminase